MNENLKKALRLLESGSYTCVLCRGEAVLADDRRGIRPLLELYRGTRDLRGFSAADRVVGKAAAFLYRLIGVDAVYANVISAPAESVLAQGGIAVYYAQKVPAIQSRTGIGLCPMETAVWDIEDPLDAPAAIEQALAGLS